MNSSGSSFRKFILLWAGELISAIGSGLTAFGLEIYVFQQTGKVSATALVALLAFMPGILLAAFAGVLADRYDRRLLMILGDSLSAVGVLFVLICMFRGEAQLWQICLGVTISSIFSSLLEPSYRATITDLLTEEQYTKASGLVQIAGSARFLISPALAGLLLVVSDVKLLLMIDMATFLVTVVSTLVVKKGLISKISRQERSFLRDLKEGWEAVSGNRGILILIIMGSLITFSLGFIQVLAVPMILAFSTKSVAGVLESGVALGMLVSSILLGVLPIKRGYVKLLSVSMFLEGVFMVGFGCRENLVLISISGFLFFAMMPFANASLDYLLRTNIDNALQGRAWAMVGVVSQLGQILAFSTAGVLADYVFTPLLVKGGLMANSLGSIIGTGSGRGRGFLIMVAGVLLCSTSLVINNLKAIRKLEKKGEKYVLQSNS